MSHVTVKAPVGADIIIDFLRQPNRSDEVKSYYWAIVDHLHRHYELSGGESEFRWQSIREWLETRGLQQDTVVPIIRELKERSVVDVGEYQENPAKGVFVTDNFGNRLYEDQTVPLPRMVWVSVTGEADEPASNYSSRHATVRVDLHALSYLHKKLQALNLPQIESIPQKLQSTSQDVSVFKNLEYSKKIQKELPVTYIRFGKRGHGIRIAFSHTRQAKLMTYIIGIVGIGTEVAIDQVVEEIRIERDKDDAVLTLAAKSSPTARERKKKIIENTVKEIQKIKGIRISVYFNDQRCTCWFELSK